MKYLSTQFDNGKELAWREKLEKAIASARITASAYDSPIPLFIMVECEYRTGGKIFHHRPGSNWAPDTGPYRQIASVL